MSPSRRSCCLRIGRVRRQHLPNDATVQPKHRLQRWGIPDPTGDCTLTGSPGCVEWTDVQRGTYSINQTTPASLPPGAEPYAPCTGGSACRLETSAVTVDSNGSVSATTTNVLPDNTSVIFPQGGTFSATQADPIVVHDFGLVPGNCDGDSDADDLVGQSPSSHCQYTPESAETTACQPFPWSCTLTPPPTPQVTAASPKMRPRGISSLIQASTTFTLTNGERDR